MQWDAVFWLHHNNVDRLWWVWQQVNGESNAPNWVAEPDDTFVGVRNGLSVDALREEV